MVPSESALAVPGLDTSTVPLDVGRIRADFPILAREAHGKPLVYLDNAATTQKPQAVLDALMEAYGGYYSNIHRGVHLLSQLSTTAHEQARRKVKEFLNAREDREVVFTRNATESINLVASSYGRAFLREGDEVLISALEHHANIVPWQMLAAAKGPVNITDIPKKTKLSSQIAFQGLGWLAREGKLEYQQKGRSIYVCLSSSECCLQ